MKARRFLRLALAGITGVMFGARGLADEDPPPDPPPDFATVARLAASSVWESRSTAEKDDLCLGYRTDPEGALALVEHAYTQGAALRPRQRRTSRRSKNCSSGIADSPTSVADPSCADRAGFRTTALRPAPVGRGDRVQPGLRINALSDRMTSGKHGISGDRGWP